MDRHQKSGKDAGEWVPRMNRCWFAGRVVAVKRKYGLTVDAREARALEGILSGCRSTEMVVAEGRDERQDNDDRETTFASASEQFSYLACRPDMNGIVEGQHGSTTIRHFVQSNFPRARREAHVHKRAYT